MFCETDNNKISLKGVSMEIWFLYTNKEISVKERKKKKRKKLNSACHKVSENVVRDTVNDSHGSDTRMLALSINDRTSTVFWPHFEL